MSRAAQSLMLVLLGAATAVTVLRGTFLNYVKPALGPWLLVAAVVLVAVGAAGVVAEVRHAGRARPGPDEPSAASPDGHGHGHQHGHASWPAWLLLVPIALVAFVVPPPLGAAGADPPAAAGAPDLRPFPPLPPGPAPVVSLPEVVLRAAADSAHSVDGREITVTGFTLARGATPAGGTDLGRVVIVCCAADAQLARLHLAGEVPDVPPDTWLEVRGRVEPGSARASDNYVPTLTVGSARRIDKPANTYAY